MFSYTFKLFGKNQKDTALSPSSKHINLLINCYRKLSRHSTYEHNYADFRVPNEISNKNDLAVLLINTKTKLRFANTNKNTTKSSTTKFNKKN